MEIRSNITLLVIVVRESHLGRDKCPGAILEAFLAFCATAFFKKDPIFKSCLTEREQTENPYLVVNQ